jgi:O-antigen/teichoic acid export membrane protein
VAQRRDEGCLYGRVFQASTTFLLFYDINADSTGRVALQRIGDDQHLEVAVNTDESQPAPESAFADRVRSAVFWRAGSQIAAQLVMWGATVLVVRLLDPKDYGLFAMTQVVLVAFNFLNGYSFATSLIQADSVSEHRIAQVFGMLILLNGTLATILFVGAPLAAHYFDQPLVANMLRVQCLLFVTTPFIALPTALLARRLDFKKQGWINLGSALIGAVTALGCALAGFGVWTLVIAPLAMFVFRAVALTIAARLLVAPVFDFRGSGDIVRFGSALLICQLFWILQSQSDIFIAGRVLDPHDLGLYSESLFITLILTGRFIPPINEVALPAYAHMIKAGRAVGPAFVSTAQIVMLITAPLYVGLSLTAAPFVETVLGPKWLEMIPLIRGLALAMPFMALQIICSPATNAMDKPNVYVRSSIAGAIVMPVAYLIGIRWGTPGLVVASQIAAPILLAITLMLTMPVIRGDWRALATAILPVAVATGAMAGTVMVVTPWIAAMAAPIRLMVTVVAGAVAYAATLKLLWPDLVSLLLDLLLRRRASLPVPGDQTTTTAASFAE